jgi:putative lipoic acid-binding regulatory protein
LLRQLYHEAEAQMLGGFSATARPQLVKRAKDALLQRLSGWDAAEKDRAVARHYDAFWLSLDTDVHQRLARQGVFKAKVMGRRVDGLVYAISTIAKAFDPLFDASTIELRESKGGNYLGVTITVTATSRDEITAMYKERGGFELQTGARKSNRVTARYLKNENSGPSAPSSSTLAAAAAAASSSAAAAADASTLWYTSPVFIIK